MTASVCIINNFNYAAFLNECLNSALAQNFNKIIVVDDGSSDQSRAIIQDFALRHPFITPIFKTNGGQLSCFEAALPLIQPDDLVFFLDADDLHPAGYASGVLDIHRQQHADFYFCQPVAFRPGEAPISQSSLHDVVHPLLRYPMTQAYTLITTQWIGSPSSGIAVTGKLLHNLLPYPFPTDWKVRADDVLVYGSAIAGSVKINIKTLGFAYRIHGKNLFAENTTWQSRKSKNDYLSNLYILLRHYSKKFNTSRIPSMNMFKREMADFPTGLPNDIEAIVYNTASHRKQYIRFLRKYIKQSVKGFFK